MNRRLPKMYFRFSGLATWLIAFDALLLLLAAHGGMLHDLTSPVLQTANSYDSLEKGAHTLFSGFSLLADGLQASSAFIATALMGVAYYVKQEGPAIWLDGQNILPENPACSLGVVFVMLLLSAALASMRRLPITSSVQLGLRAFGLAWLANTVRVTLLAVWVAFPNLAGNIDVMQVLPHIALVLLTVGPAMVALFKACRTVTSISPGDVVLSAVQAEAATRQGGRFDDNLHSGRQGR